jgi:hypothetical protein
MFGTRIWSKLVLGVGGPIIAATLLLAGTQAAAFGASALPVVLSFGASRTSIPNRGGTIVLNARLQYASSCEISSSVRLRGSVTAVVTLGDTLHTHVLVTMLGA